MRRAASAPQSLDVFTRWPRPPFEGHEQVREVNEVYGSSPPLARSTAELARLPKGASVEIDLIALG